jgi:hypothetical protein
MLTYKEIPDIETGYLFEQNRGWFGVVVPTEKVNYVRDPHFVNYPSTGDIVITFASGIVTDSTDGLFEPSAISATYGGTQDIRVTYDMGNGVGLYTFSIYMKTSGIGEVTISLVNSTFSGGTYVTKDVTITNEYTRIYLTAILPNDGDTKAFEITSDVDITMTSAQLEEGSLTTFLYGGMDAGIYNGDDAYYWQGVPNSSNSVRTENAYSGGEIVSLYEYGFRLSEVGGLGYPDLSPNLFDQSQLDSYLYSCSNVEQREVELTGSLQGCTFEEFMCAKGNLAKLFYHKRRPIRVYYTPYDSCDKETPCLYFDMVYTDGFNENLQSLHGEEISISGIALSPCLYTCKENKIISASLDEYLVQGEDDSVYFINSNDEVEKANVPALLNTPLGMGVIDTTVCGNVLYAIIAQRETGAAGGREFTFLMRYENGNWTEIARSQHSTNVGLGYLDTERGPMQALECVPDGVSQGIYVGGYWNVGDITAGTGVGGNANISQSGFIYRPSSNSIDRLLVFDTNYPSNNTGQIADIHYDPVTRNVYFGGTFTSINFEFSGQTIISDNIAFLSEKTGYSAFPGMTDLGFTNGTTSHPFPKYSVAPTVHKIVTHKDNIFLLTNYETTAINLIADEQAYMHKFSIDNLHTITRESCAFPIESNGNTNAALTDMLNYGGKDLFFVSGKFTQATSDYNNAAQVYNATNDYLSGIAAFDPDGYTTPLSSWFGRYEPLTVKLKDQVGTNAYGVYENDTNTTTPSYTNESDYAVLTELNGHIIISGRVSAYGASGSKESSCGVAEYKPLSSTNLSAGVFVPPTIQSRNLVGECFTYVKSIEGISDINAIISTGFPENIQESELFYNNGFLVDTCSTDDDAVEASIYISTRASIFYDVSGIRNLSSGKEIYFEPFDLPVTSTTIFRHNGTTIEVERDGNVNTVTDITNTGNPLKVSDGDRVQLIFDMASTYDSASTVLAPLMALTYKECFHSLEEIMLCEYCE